MRHIITAVLVALASTNPCWAADAPKPQARAISALADFATSYTFWMIEARCRAMKDADHVAFRSLIDDDLNGLSRVFEQKMIAAATGAGTDTANDPKFATCDDAADGAALGFDLAKQVAAELAALPPGYKLTVTD